MNKIFFIMFLLVLAPACEYENNVFETSPVGNLRVVNQTTCGITDVATGMSEYPKCEEVIAPGESAPYFGLLASSEPRRISVTLQTDLGAEVRKDFQVVVTEDAFTVLTVSGVPGCDDIAPPVGIVSNTN